MKSPKLRLALSRGLCIFGIACFDLPAMECLTLPLRGGEEVLAAVVVGGGTRRGESWRHSLAN